jgi:hypothetical protein
MGTGPFPAVKRPEQGANNPTASSAEVVNGLELYILHFSSTAYACHEVIFTFTSSTKVYSLTGTKFYQILNNNSQIL